MTEARDDGKRQTSTPPSGAEGVTLDHFFELSLDLLTVAGFDGYFKRLSPMWSRTLGWTLEEFLSRPSVEFVHPDDREATLAARRGLKDGVPLTGLVNRYRCKDGSYRWLEWRSVADAERKLVYAVARDVTAQRAAEEERQRVQQRLRNAERMASIGRLASGVAHEINNPLAFILANLRAALTELPAFQAPEPELKVEMEQMLTDSLEGAERVRAIVQGLSTFARLGAQPRAPTEVQPVLEDTLRAVTAELPPQVRVVERYGPMPKVEANSASLSEIFRCLLAHAAHSFSGPRPGADELRVVTSTNGAGQAVIEIQDTGVGMPEELLSRILEPFVSTREAGRGMGLGLSICNDLITELGGRIAVTSKLGQGTTFRVELPAAAVGAGPPAD